jgi:outer membrane beta-barrel protein
VTAKTTALALIALLGSVPWAPARAAGPEPQRAAIQERKFQLFHELKLSAGAMPLNAFQKGWTLSLSYTHHLNEYLAWELVQVTGALLTSTNLRESLIDQFAVPPEDFSAPRLMLTTGLEVNPLYGKQALLNDGVSHHALIGGVYAGLVLGDRPSVADMLSDLRPAVGFGLGYRLFIDETYSARLDLRDFLTFRRAIRDNESFQVENVLLMTLSFSFNLWRDDA